MDDEYIDRLDPDRETRELIKSMGSLGDPAMEPLLKKIGVDEDAIREVREGPGRIADFEADLNRVSDHLAPLGWIVSAAGPHEEYKQASLLAEAGKAEEAERVLVDCWNENDRLEMHLRVGGLYSGSQEQNLIAVKRHELIREALDAHRQGLYGPAIAVVLAQIDGIVFDMTGPRRARSTTRARRRSTCLME